MFECSTGNKASTQVEDGDYMQTRWNQKADFKISKHFHATHNCQTEKFHKLQPLLQMAAFKHPSKASGEGRSLELKLPFTTTSISKPQASL